MNEEVPLYVQNTLKNLNIIWSKYRQEHIEFPTDSFKHLTFRKSYTAWMIQEYANDPRDGTRRYVTVIFIPKTQTLNTEFTSMLITQAEENKFEHVVIIHKTTTKIKANLQKVKGIIWEVLSYDDLSYIAPENVLVPKYRILNEHIENPEQIRKGLAHDDSQVKNHINQDIMSKLLGFRSGDIVEVTEFNSTIGVHKYLRRYT